MIHLLIILGLFFDALNYIVYVESCGGMIVDEELEGILEEVAVVYFKVPSNFCLATKLRMRGVIPSLPICLHGVVLK
jgi:hypothetical protein